MTAWEDPNPRYAHDLGAGGLAAGAAVPPQSAVAEQQDHRGFRASGSGCERGLEGAAGDDRGHRGPVLRVCVDVAVDLLAVGRVGRRRRERLGPSIGAQ